MMKYELIPALKKGRSVFTNINGLNKPDCLAALSKITGRSPTELKELLTFFPIEGRVYIGPPENGVFLTIKDNLHQLVRLGDEDTGVMGDLIIIDEAADPDIFWCKNKQANPDIWIFFKKHRQYLVDIVLMAHKPRDILSELLGLTQEFTKYAKQVGINEKKYTYEKWMGGYSRSSGGSMVRKDAEFYDKAIFACYKSTMVGEGGNDGTMDNRFNLWKSKELKYAVAGVVICIVGLPWFFSSFFGEVSFLNPAPAHAQVAKAAPLPNGSTPVQVVQAASVPARSAPVQAAAQVDYEKQLHEASLKNDPVYKKVMHLLTELTPRYEGYFKGGNIVRGVVSFWDNSKIITRLSFDDLALLDVKVIEFDSSADFIKVEFDKKEHLILSRPHDLHARNNAKVIDGRR